MRNYNTRGQDSVFRGVKRDLGYYIGSGDKVTSLNLSFLVSYEVLENMFVDAGVQYRTYNRAIEGNSNTTVVSLGFRWNIARRVFDF